MSTGYRVLHAANAFWRPSNATGVPNTDLARQLGTDALGARLCTPAGCRRGRPSFHKTYLSRET